MLASDGLRSLFELKRSQLVTRLESIQFHDRIESVLEAVTVGAEVCLCGFDGGYDFDHIAEVFALAAPIEAAASFAPTLTSDKSAFYVLKQPWQLRDDRSRLLAAKCCDGFSGYFRRGWRSDLLDTYSLAGLSDDAVHYYEPQSFYQFLSIGQLSSEVLYRILGNNQETQAYVFAKLVQAYVALAHARNISRYCNLEPGPEPSDEPFLLLKDQSIQLHLASFCSWCRMRQREAIKESAVRQFLRSIGGEAESNLYWKTESRTASYAMWCITRTSLRRLTELINQFEDKYDIPRN